jgi:hypothetical protein
MAVTTGHLVSGPGLLSLEEAALFLSPFVYLFKGNPQLKNKWTSHIVGRAFFNLATRKLAVRSHFHCLETLPLLIFLIFFVTTFPSLSEASVLEDLNADFIAHFDKDIRVDKPSGTIFEQTGRPKIIPDGVSGSALSLGPNQYLALRTRGILNGLEGTISMWVRPHWSPASEGSHTFVSFEWAQPKRGYFVLSRGWWEPAGSGRTYFVANNQEASHTSKEVYYPPANWVHAACTWKNGDQGFARLYVDGFLVSESKGPSGFFTPGDKLYLGTDAGSDLANNRGADSDFDEFAIFRRALNGSEIRQIYGAHARQKYVELKDQDGTVLESRVVFDEAMFWVGRNEAERLIDRIKRAGFNVFVPCVWHGMGVRYPSAGIEKEGNRVFTSDPLKTLIEVAHRNGIEVHPMFTVALRQRDFHQEFFDHGTPEQAFDVHKPQFRKFIADIIVDVAAKYDIDGVNLDYIRTMGMCTSESCQADYARQFGRKLLDDVSLTQRDGTLDPHVQQWQDQAILSIVMDVATKVKAVRPRAIISVDGYPLFGPSPEGREEISWANADLIGAIFNMDYGRVPFFNHIDFVKDKLRNPRKLFLLCGNYDYDSKGAIFSRPAADLADIISVSRQKLPHGIGVYIYSMLSDAQTVELSGGVFSNPARPAWRASTKEVGFKDSKANCATTDISP